MTTQIQSVHFDADKKLLTHVEEKVAKLKTFHGSIINSQIILRLDKSNDNSNKIAEIKLHTAGSELFAKKQCATFEEAIDSACAALKSQIKKYKEKMLEMK